MNFQEKVKRLMKEKGVNQKGLAEKANITEASMSKYLSGERTPRIDVIVNLAAALGTTTDYLLGSKEPSNPSFEVTYEAIARSKESFSEEDKKSLIRLLLDD